MERLKSKDTNKHTISTRDGFGQGLIEAGKANKKVLALCADLSESTRIDGFKKTFPDIDIYTGQRVS